MIQNPNLPAPADVIPHRPPHLWLDGIVELEAGQSAQGFWTPGEEHFQGHFDAMPVLPGVKQIESLAQLGCYVVMAGSEQPLLPLFKGIEAASFERPVVPGERLDVSITMLDWSKRNFQGEGLVEVDGETACRARIVGTVLPARLAKRLLNLGKNE